MSNAAGTVKLTVNSPKALAVMMRQAQCDPSFRERLMTQQIIPFGSLATALEAHDALAAERDELRAQLTAAQSSEERLKLDAARYRGLRSMSTYRYDGGCFYLDFDEWIEVTEVDEFESDESRPTPPNRFDAAIDAALSTHPSAREQGEGA